MNRTTQLSAIATLLVASIGCAAGPPDDGGPGADPDPGAGGGSGTQGAGFGDHSDPARVVGVQYEIQTTSYWCGPTATDIVLSARIAPPGQATLASQLGTTTNGTDWIGQVTGVLNNNLHAAWYTTREMPSDPPTQAQRDLLWRDLVRAVDDGFPLVANIVAPPSNHPPGYPSSTIYHYLALIGYNADSHEAFIADSANFGGHQEYWLSFAQLATLIPPKGYTALADCARDAVVGKIAEKFDALGGCSSSVVGPPITAERGTPDGVGRYSVFERGSIYWTPQLGAHEVHGRIRDAWAAAGWEAGQLGYPSSDEYAETDGRRSDFEHGHIHWSAATDATTTTMEP